MPLRENGFLLDGEFCQAILDALESRAAVLDQKGTLVAVNQAWMRLGERRGGPDVQKFSVGDNYLEALERAIGREAAHARRGIEDVLRGTAENFVLEYPCSETINPHWFQMRVTPLRSGEFRGVLVAHTAITDRRRADLDLRTTQERLASVSRQVSDVIFVLAVEKEGRYRFEAVNPAFLNSTGLREDQVVGRLVQEVIPEPALSNVLEKYREVVRELREVRWEQTAEFPSGTRHGQVLITPIQGPDQTCTHLIGSVRDVTASKEVENALRESEERFRQMAENIREVFWMTDAADTRTIYISPAYEEIWGQPCEKQYRNPKSFLEAIHPDDRERVIAALAAHRNVGKYCEEYRVVRPDGSIRWIRDRAFPIRNATGEIYRVAGIAEDITERKAAELRFRSIVENSQEAVILTDANVVCMYASPGVTRILGFDTEELVGTQGMGYVHPDDLPVVQAHRQRVHTQPHSQNQAEFRVRHRDGSWRWIQVSDTNRLDDPHLKAVVTNFRDVTERKLAAETLRQVSEFREAIIQTAAEGICAWSSRSTPHSTEISVWNDRMVEITGYTREEINAQGWPQALFPASTVPTSPLEPLAELPTCATLHDELREITRKDGSRRTVSLSISRLPANQLELDECICVALVHDVTDRALAEEALRHSERKHAGLVNSLDGIVWEADPRTFQFTFVSQQAERILGYPVSRWTGETDFWRRHLHPDDQEAALQLCQEAIRKCESHTFTYRMLAADGREVWLQDVVTVISKDGQALALRGVMVDVTERIGAQATLEQQRLRMGGIINSAMDGIITIDEEQRIVVFNAAAERIFRIRPDEALGATIDRFIPERYRANHAEYVREFGRTGATPRAMGKFGAISGLRTDGEEFPLDASISQILLPEGKLFTITCRDASDRVRAEEMRQRLEAQLRQSRKMDAIGQLAGGVAHDFNNLLTVILAYSDIVLSKLTPQDPLVPAVKSINDAGERAASLTRQLLSFSRQMVLSPKVLDLNTVVSDTETMLHRLIGEDILLSVALDSGIRRIMVDPGQLSQVLLNLVVNARDAMPRGGTITITTSEAELESVTTQSEPRPGKQVLLTISDTGLGMSPEVQSHLFEPFFTTKGVGKGTGLGLAAVHGIVRQSGGQIEVESSPGHGTTFRIYFPAVDEWQADAQERSPDDYLRGNETVLLVEDEDSVRELARVVLQSYGYQVLTACNGAEALSVAKSHHEPIDLLVTDVVMPALGGRELAEILQSGQPRLQVLYVSGYTDDAVVRHGIQQDQVAFLPKPFDRRGLATKVREVLDERSDTP